MSRFRNWLCFNVSSFDQAASAGQVVKAAFGLWASKGFVDRLEFDDLLVVSIDGLVQGDFRNNRSQSTIAPNKKAGARPAFDTDKTPSHAA
jgi:hypothetical protein